MTRRYGDRVALHELTLAIDHGEIFGLLGPNGSGKTTALRMLATLLPPHAGTVRLLSYDVVTDAMQVRRHIGVMPERPSLYERQTVDANIRFWAEVHQLPDPDAAVANALHFVALEDRRNDLVGSLSKGLKQRVALARAIVHRPSVLLLDEPSSGLDPSAAASMETLIRDLAHEGTTVLLNTHRLAEAERLCDRVAILREGRLLRLGTPRQVRASLLGNIVEVELAGIVDTPVRRAIESFPAVRETWWANAAVRCRLVDAERDTPELVARLVAAGARIVAVQPAGDLERAYLELMSQPLPGSLAA
ncbi:ABC transporter ATP-binding protein [Tepidiforma sp.]|uniref:ABC transporter ATP-binding protein n=1 Tax=Tepidiforma sp. TaxID=2682230 RepID=UPI002ADD7B7C|nr:ABC transporter ATP-binding protein [Tepidiforma sp.]